MKSNMKKKTITLIIVVLGIVSFIVGTTTALLVSKTETVVNTFTYGDINIQLTETDTKADNDNDINTNSYKMIPGNKITKDPLITILKDSENSWLFVSISKSENFDDFMEYEIKEGWTQLEGNENVYYMEVNKLDKDQQFEVLKGNSVTVKETVTKAMLNELDKNENTNYPTLSFTAYAVQRDSNIAAIDTAKEAWELIKTSNAQQNQ